MFVSVSVRAVIFLKSVKNFGVPGPLIRKGNVLKYLALTKDDSRLYE